MILFKQNLRHDIEYLLIPASPKWILSPDAGWGLGCLPRHIWVLTYHHLSSINIYSKYLAQLTKDTTIRGGGLPL